MLQNNRSATRERKDGEPKRYDMEEERRYSSNQREERARGMARVNGERTDQRINDRENDLYERQSI